MAFLKFNYEYGGNGTKENPFRIPVVPFVKTPLKPVTAEIVMEADHGRDEQGLYLVGFNTNKYMSIGNGKSVKNGHTVTQEIFIYGREKFTEPSSILVRATKYAKQINGQYVNGVGIRDENFKTPKSIGSGDSTYWFVSFNDEEQAEYEKRFASVAEVEKPKLVQTKVIDNPIDDWIDDVISKIDTINLSELTQIEEAIRERLNDIILAIEEKSTATIEEPKPEVTVEPTEDVETTHTDPIYTPETQDGVNFNTSFEWESDSKLLVHIDLDRVDEFGGFSAFQFDVPFVRGLNYVQSISKDTYFDDTPENDGSYNKNNVVRGWTWRAYKNEKSLKVRIGGFASSLNKITSDGRLLTLEYDVADPRFSTFTLEFIRMYFHLQSHQLPINPKNPRLVVTKS